MCMLRNKGCWCESAHLSLLLLPSWGNNNSNKSWNEGEGWGEGWEKSLNLRPRVASCMKVLRWGQERERGEKGTWREISLPPVENDVSSCGWVCGGGGETGNRISCWMHLSCYHLPVVLETGEEVPEKPLFGSKAMATHATEPSASLNEIAVIPPHRVGSQWGESAMVNWHIHTHKHTHTTPRK